MFFISISYKKQKTNNENCLNFIFNCSIIILRVIDMKINEYYYHLKGKDDFVTKNHSHNEIEFIQVISGNGVVLKDDKSYILQKQFLYVIDARKPHVVNPMDCDSYVRNKIVIDANSFFDICGTIGLTEVAERILTAPPISTESGREIDSLFKKITTLCGTNKKENQGFACAQVLELMHFIFLKLKEENKETGTVNHISEALNIIAEKNGVTTLSEISNILHVNKYYLCHLFKNETGITLSEYLAEKRYEKCTLLLCETSYSIEKIAELCGFASTSSLTRFFKKKSGICPKDYKKMHMNKLI